MESMPSDLRKSKQRNVAQVGTATEYSDYGVVNLVTKHITITPEK